MENIIVKRLPSGQNQVMVFNSREKVYRLRSFSLSSCEVLPQNIGVGADLLSNPMNST